MQYLNKTVLFNILAFLTVLALAFGYADFRPDPAVLEWAGSIVAFVNLVVELWKQWQKLRGQRTLRQAQDGTTRKEAVE